MYIPGVGKLRWGFVLFCAAVLVLIMFALVLYPNLPTPPATFTSVKNEVDSAPLVLVEAENLGPDPKKTPLVCPTKNSRCTTINDDRVNYDQSIVNDFVSFIDVLKAKVIGVPSFSHNSNNNNKMPSILVVDIGAFLGYFSFSLGNSLSSSSSSSTSTSSDATKFLTIDASSQNINAIQQTQTIAKKNTARAGENSWFQNVHAVQAALSSSNGHQCLLLSEDNEINDFSLMCPSTISSVVEKAEEGQRTISFIDKATSHKKSFAVRAGAPSLSTLDELFSSNSNNNNGKGDYFKLSNKDIVMAKIDVGSAANAMKVLEGAQKTFFASSSSSSSSSSPHVIAVRLSSLDLSLIVAAASSKRFDLLKDEIEGFELSPEFKKSLGNTPFELPALSSTSSSSTEQLLTFMSRRGYVAYLPSNKSIVPLRDFSGNIFDPDFPPISSRRAATVYFIRGDISNFLVCSETNVALILGVVALLIFTGAAYMYFLNSRMHRMFKGGAGGGGGGGFGLGGLAPGNLHSSSIDIDGGMMGGGGGGVGSSMLSHHHHHHEEAMPNFNMSPAFGMLNYSAGGGPSTFQTGHNNINMNKDN